MHLTSPSLEFVDNKRTGTHQLAALVLGHGFFFLPFSSSLCSERQRPFGDLSLLGEPYREPRKTPGVLGTVPVYSWCPGRVTSSATFYSKKMINGRLVLSKTTDKFWFLL